MAYENGEGQSHHQEPVGFPQAQAEADQASAATGTEEGGDVLTILILKSLATLGQPCLTTPEFVRILALRDVKVVVVPDHSLPLLREFPIEIAILDDRRRGNPFGVIEHRTPVPGSKNNQLARASRHRHLHHRSGTRGR